jgi:hypothetical protein
MKRGWIITGALLEAGTLSLSANNPDNPYRVISEKNAFRLSPPPPPPVVAPVVVEQPANLRFTGLSWDGDAVSAWLVINPATPTDPPVYLTLAPGQKASALELLEINDKSEEVKVRYQGKDRTLTLERAGKAPTAIPGAPMVPGMPQPTAAIPGMNNVVANPGSVVANPTFNPAAANNINPVGNFQPPVNNAVAPFNNNNNNTGGRFVPTRTIRGGAGAQPQYQSQGGIEEAAASALNMEVQKAMPQTRAIYPPLPPTPLNP